MTTTTRRTQQRHPRCRTHPTPTTGRFRPRTPAADSPRPHIHHGSRANRPNQATENRAADSPPPGAEWLTPNQAATHIQVPVRQLQQWRYLKKGPPYSLAGRAVRYRLADLDAWLTANRVEK